MGNLPAQIEEMRKSTLQGVKEGGGVRYSAGIRGVREDLTAIAGGFGGEWAVGIGRGSRGTGGRAQADGTSKWKGCPYFSIAVWMPCRPHGGLGPQKASEVQKVIVN